MTLTMRVRRGTSIRRRCSTPAPPRWPLACPSRSRSGCPSVKVDLSLGPPPRSPSSARFARCRHTRLQHRSCSSLPSAHGCSTRPALSGAIHLDPSRVHLGLCRRRTRSSPRAAARRWPSSRAAGGRAHRLAQRRECEQRLFTALAVNSPPTGSDNALRLKNEAGRSMGSAPEKRQLGKVFGLGAKTAIDLVEAAVSVFTAAGCPPLLRLGVTDTAHDAPRLPAGCRSYHASAPTVGRPSHSPLRVASTASRPSAPCRACCSRRSTSRSLTATSGRARGPRCGRRRSAHSQRHALVALVPV